MTIKGLQKLIGKDAYNLTLLNQYAGNQIVRQHLSVWGRAIYPMDGLPVMDEETLLAVLDVPRERWKNCHVLRADADSTLLTEMMEDNMDSDRPLEEMGIQLITGGREYKFLLEPLRDECVAIRPEYLKPIGLTSEHTYWLRETGWDDKTGEAQHVIVVKLGMQNVAAIAKNIDWGSDEKTVAQLGRICDKASAIQREWALYAGREKRNDHHRGHTPSAGGGKEHCPPLVRPADHHQAGDLAGLLPDLAGGKQAAARRAVEPGRGRPDLRRMGGHGRLV